MKASTWLLVLAPARALSDEAGTSPFSLILGARFSSNLSRSGATLYDSWQLAPFFVASFLRDRLHFRGNSLEWFNLDSGQMSRSRFKLAYFSDDPLYETGGQTRGFRNSRPSQLEFTVTLAFFYPDFNAADFELEAQFIASLREGSGQQIELTPRATLARFSPTDSGPRFQPQAFCTLGLGNVRQNSYLYGSGAGSLGPNHLTFGLQVISPGLGLDPAYPSITLARYQILGDQKQGSLVADKTSGYQLSLTLGFEVLKGLL